MKKIVAALILLLAFSINTSAQDKVNSAEINASGTNTINPETKAKNLTTELTKLVSLDDNVSQGIYNLLKKKYEILDDPNATAERKAEMSRVVEAKIRAGLDTKQTDVLEKNPELLNRLIK